MSDYKKLDKIKPDDKLNIPLIEQIRAETDENTLTKLKQQLFFNNVKYLLKCNGKKRFIKDEDFNYLAWMALEKSLQLFDIKLNTKFSMYMWFTLLGITQRFYHYENNLIHLPVMKKKVMENPEVLDIIFFEKDLLNDEEEEGIDYMEKVDKIINEYRKTVRRRISIRDLDIFYLYLTKGMDLTIAKFGLTRQRIHQIVGELKKKLIAFRDKKANLRSDF